MSGDGRGGDSVTVGRAAPRAPLLLPSDIVQGRWSLLPASAVGGAAAARPAVGKPPTHPGGRRQGFGVSAERLELHHGRGEGRQGHAQRFPVL